MADAAKEPIVAGRLYDAEVLPDEVSEVSEKQGTGADRHAMWRMGKVQELRRNFRFVSIFGFSMILMASWETMLGQVPLHQGENTVID